MTNIAQNLQTTTNCTQIDFTMENSHKNMNSIENDNNNNNNNKQINIKSATSTTRTSYNRANLIAPDYDSKVLQQRQQQQQHSNGLKTKPQIIKKTMRHLPQQHNLHQETTWQI